MLTNISGANFCDSNLNSANLTRVQAGGTDFTGAKFWGTCLEKWYIDMSTKLDDVSVNYVYLRRDNQKIKYFQAGEFQLYFQLPLMLTE